ncbi:hypothetical protein GOAMR_68_00090 [Gordonia amarae NBRC 15530]|uniref:Uncharacterized protein n=1 Tax=Gordonia amarae NBRC 15530 TaxID=1075090 RepID=G7GV28_9ACTN|nr:hypothetical protein GOAMR_68_00090 [Gordonia amarae NBRC 15530]
MFQSVLDQLPECFADAMLLDVAVEKSLADLRQRRINDTGRGNGAPPVFHKSMNKAVVVAAVGGIEAFFETLAVQAKEIAEPLPENGNDWYTITGRKGEIQTPSPRNIRKLFWSIFHVDLMESWDLSITASETDTGEGNGTWRSRHNYRHTGPDAFAFLDATVKIRHSFAHGDPSQSRRAVGMAHEGVNGGYSVASHHAFNAVSAALQAAIQSTLYLADSLGLPYTPKPRWKVSWENVRGQNIGLDYWLRGAPVWEEIVTWKGAPTDEHDPNVDLQDADGVPAFVDPM